MGEPRGAAAQAREILAACSFAAAPGLGAASLTRIESFAGSFADALAAGPLELLARAEELRLPAATRAFFAENRDLAAGGEVLLEHAARAGAHVVLASTPEYPPALRDLGDPPPLLWVKGGLVPRAPRVAIVGTRAASDWGLAEARALAEDLAARGVEVISGGALGIDTAAHRGALSRGGSSTAVLGTGIDRPYPERNAGLFEELARAGAVFTEVPPGTAPSRGSFPRRNRLVAALADALVVIEAAPGSGALLTAERARQLGRPLFAVPGPHGDPRSLGPEQLFAQGARPVRSAAELLRALGRLDSSAAVRPPAAPAPEQKAAPPDVGAAALELWVLLDADHPRHVDELAAGARIPAAAALAHLAELELAGACVQNPGKFFLRRSSR